MSPRIRKAAHTSARTFAHIDWILFAAALCITLLGLATMYSFSSDNAFFDKQVIWIVLALAVFFVSSMPSYEFLRRTQIISILFVATVGLLALVFVLGSVVKGAQQRFNLGIFFFQPSDPAKLVLIATLAKYFTRRHIEIKHIKHILISGAYTFLVFVLVFFQPDFGSALIIGAIWLGLVLVAGLSWKHLLLLFVAGGISFSLLWNFGLHQYQKERVLTFIHPLTDLQGAGYNAYQSTVAVGSGELLGKGIGYGTQSKLRFLPEYETDFIFAAYAEEWGFFGALILFILFGIVIVRVLMIAAHGADNFISLMSVGVAVYLFSQFIVHVGMNMGLMPITGTTLPFMSYGGSHLLTEYLALGVLMGMRRHARATLQAHDGTELIGAL